MKIETDEVTAQVKVIEIETTQSSAFPVQAIVVVEQVDGPKGAIRHFTQVVPVNDAELSRRILAEVHEGEEIIATIINEWRESGCDTYLAGFKNATDIEPEAIVKNGAKSIVQNDTSQFVIPSMREPKATVRH